MPTKPSIKSVNDSIGAHLRNVRMSQGKSQTYVGDALGVAFQQVQKYENGTNRISAASLEVACKALNTDIGTFFKGVK